MSLRHALICAAVWGGCRPDPPPVPATPALPRLFPHMDGVPVGFWGLNGKHSAQGMADVRTRFGARWVQTASADPVWTTRVLLPAAQEAGVAVSLRLTGPHRYYTSPAGDFDLAAWRARLDVWADAGLADHIADGTLAGHMVLDDIDDFPGRGATAADLDAMAAHSARVLPGLMTFVRRHGEGLPVPAAGRYAHLDAAVHQHKASQGSIEDWLPAQIAAAEAVGLASICGLNIAAGGDGRSGQPGWGEGTWAMSGEEIAQRGAVVRAEPRCQAVLLWEYDAEELWTDGSVGAAWFDRPAQHRAILALTRTPAR